MKWKLDTERPIYLQIVEHIEKDINENCISSKADIQE